MASNIPPQTGFSNPVAVPNLNLPVTRTFTGKNARTETTGPYDASVYGNPFGGAITPGHYKDFRIFGGVNDLVKSVATRNLAIKGILDQFNREPVPSGLMAALGNSVRQLGGGRLGQEAFQTFAPGLENQFRTGEDVYKSNLIGLLTNAYTLGGSLYGAAYKARDIAKTLSKQKDAAKTARLQAIVGGVMNGLGLNKYGESDTTVGAIGVGEM